MWLKYIDKYKIVIQKDKKMEEPVHFFTAKTLRNVGYNVPINRFYDNDGIISTKTYTKVGVPTSDYNNWKKNLFYRGGYSAPSLKSAIDWVKKEVDIEIEIKDEEKLLDILFMF